MGASLHLSFQKDPVFKIPPASGTQTPPAKPSDEASTSSVANKGPVEPKEGAITDTPAHVVIKPSWLDLFKCPSATMEKKSTPFLLESGELCVTIPNSVIKLHKNIWEAFILGHFHGNLPSHGALHAILNGIWSNRHRDITISKIGASSVLIRIPNAETRKRVLSQGIWNIEG